MPGLGDIILAGVLDLVLRGVLYVAFGYSLSSVAFYC